MDHGHSPERFGPSAASGVLVSSSDQRPIRSRRAAVERVASSLAACLKLLALLALVALAYGPAVPGFFVSDDFDMLSGAASDLFSPASGFGRFMPVAATAHRLTALLSGLNPIPPHAVQVGLHGAAALLVYALGRTLGLGRGAAWAAAALWALYPRHHQAVMWFGAIAIGLAGLFGLAAIYLFGRAWREGTARAGWTAVGAYALALLSHESAVVLPALAAAVGVYLTATRRAPRPCWPPPAWVWAALAVGAVHLGTVAWAYRVRAALYPDSGYRFVGLGAELAQAPLRYAAWLVAPPPWTEAWTAGTAGLLVGIPTLLGAGVWAWRGGALARLGVAWGGVAALPVVLFGVYGMTDRYCYLPTVGVALAVVSGLAGRRWARSALALYVLVCGTLLVGVAAEWRAAGASTRSTLDALATWATAAAPARPEAVLLVGVPFKRATTWPGSQVYVFSTGVVGATHLATGWPALRVSYTFLDEYPTLPAQLAALPVAPGPPGLHLLALGPEFSDHTPRLGAALPLLEPLRWRGASRLPVEWQRYRVWSTSAGPSP